MLFNKLPNPDAHLVESRKYKTCRQVVAVILVSPDWHSLSLLLSEQACADGRQNWSPVQGGVEPGEGLAEAAVREIHEETGLVIMPSAVTYLVTTWRRLPDDHPRREEYESMQYHWVLAVAPSYTLEQKAGVSEIGWYHLSGLVEWATMNMSPEKREMFLMALKAATEGPLAEHLLSKTVQPQIRDALLRYQVA